MHQSLHVPTFHVEHIVPQCAGGQSTADNLALACPACNLHKSNRIQVVDPDTRNVVPLFHPRQQLWTEHFQWLGFLVSGRTAVGRATVVALHLNDPKTREYANGRGCFRVVSAGR
jgi:hypothetical protein